MASLIYCVCSNCSHQEKEKAIIEINFYEGIIYWLCPKCNKQNKIEISKPSAKLPKTRVSWR